MRKPNYALNFFSYYPHSKEVVYKILDCDSLKQILFPAEVVQHEPVNSVIVNSGEDIREANLISSFITDTRVYFPINGKQGIELSVNIKHDLTYGHNTVVIQFLDDFLTSQRLSVKLIESLCSEIIPIFRPHYASAFDASRRPTRSTPSGGSMFYEDEPSQRYYPLEVRWVTYFGLEMLEFLKVERFQNLKTYFKKYQLDQGVLLLLQEEVWQYTNEAHLRRQEQAEQELGFPELLAD